MDEQRLYGLRLDDGKVIVLDSARTAITAGDSMGYEPVVCTPRWEPLIQQSMSYPTRTPDTQGGAA